MLIYPLHKLVHLRSNTSDGITAIYVNTALRTLALALIGIFLPVFLFLETQKVFGEGVVIGLYGIVAYYFIQRLITTFFLVPASKVIARAGFRWSVIIANVLLIILLGLFSVADKVFWILPVAAIVHGFQSPLYWLAYRSLFAEEGTSSHLGEKVSASAIIGRIAGISGPILGGVIITVWGFPALFIVALVIVVFSGIPFFFMHHHKQKVAPTFSSVVHWLRVKKHRNEEISFIGRHIDDTITALFWPVFMFMAAGTYERQGLAASLGLISGTAVVYLAGRIFDKKHSLRFFKMGVIGTSLMWLFKGFARSLGQLVIVEVGTSVVSPFYWVTYDSLLYERARDKGEDVLTFMVSRMFVVSVAVFLVLGFVVITAAFPWRFWALWGLAALGVLFSRAMWEKRDEEEQKQEY